MERAKSREDPFHVQAQLRRQLQHIATHFLLQHQKYARHTHLIHRAWATVLRSQADLFTCFECGLQPDVTAENKPLLSQAVNEWIGCSQTNRGARALFVQRTQPESAANRLTGCRSSQMRGSRSPPDASSAMRQPAHPPYPSESEYDTGRLKNSHRFREVPRSNSSAKPGMAVRSGGTGYA